MVKLQRAGMTIMVESRLSCIKIIILGTELSQINEVGIIYNVSSPVVVYSCLFWGCPPKVGLSLS